MEIAHRQASPRAVPDLTTDDALAVATRYNSEAFAALYERHIDSVFRYLRARGADESDAAELAGVTFERALRHIHRYRPGGSGFRAWVLRIARNALIDTQRRARPTISLDHGAGIASTADTPEEALMAAEERRLILRHVARLSPVQQDALSLRFGGGLSSRQIGNVIGKSEAATKKLLTRSLNVLKEALTNER